MGGDDKITNLAVLTPEEHYVCHQLLVKMYPNNYKLAFAANMMTTGQKRNNKLYGWIRRKLTTGRKIKSEHTCPVCNGVFYMLPYQVKTGKIHCSKNVGLSQQKIN